MDSEHLYKYLTLNEVQFVTPRQAEAIKAYVETGSIAKAAKRLKCNQSSTRNLLARAAKSAASKGWVPGSSLPTPIVPEPFMIKGRSTLYGGEGDIRLQWVKESLDDQKFQEMLREAVGEFNQNIKPVKPRKPPKKEPSSDGVTLYVLADIHIGGLSWGEETGDDWDIEIAEKTIEDALHQLINQTPDTKYGFFCNLGDALHYDSWKAVTPTSGNVLDTDSRYPKVVRTCIRLFNNAIDLLLQKHQNVVVLHAQGNHDPTGSVWLQEATALRYEDEPRCEVIRSAAPYYSWLHPSKKLFLGFHHGHQTRFNQLIQVFTSRDYWGQLSQARQAYIHVGHSHHRQVKEYPGGIVEMHQTMAGRSSYEAHAGYLSDRSMPAIVYSSDGHEISRITYYPRRPK
ncbi:MAG: hypothetical protein KatS3mg109_0128 [Pirellulaceae bacterium]|nr:MAG: hypothetical protein KatS3mg109_0128 [Pirellulaceae bacterium]